MIASAPQARLARTTFTTSRLLEFCSQKELTAQTGYAPDHWPYVLLKELTDNGLDACEEGGVAPQIRIEVTGEAIIVSDNGPGLPVSTLDGVLDFSVRTSSREAYCAPDRGQQGNALKTVLAMPFALDGEEGRVTIEAHGQAHEVTFRVNQIQQVPVVGRTTASSTVKTGTRITVHWPHKACHILLAARRRFLQFGALYPWFNPHLALALAEDDDVVEMPAISPAWPKWGPSDPTSPHWYTPETLSRLVAAYVRHDLDRGGDRTIREFVAEFRGLSSSVKQARVLKATLGARARMRSLCPDDRIDRHAITALLQATQAHSTPVKPEALGVIGKDNLVHRFAAIGAELDSFAYRKMAGFTRTGLPWVVETGFAWHPKAEYRDFIPGVNFSPALSNPFRSLGVWGRDLEAVLADRHAGPTESVVVFVHLICPQISFTDRGKSAVALPVSDSNIADAIIDTVTGVTAKWEKQRKAEQRHKAAELNRRVRLISQPKREPKNAEEKPEPTGVLGEKLEAMASDAEVSFEALTVLSAQNDPYLAWRQQGDGKWFADQFNRLVAPDARKHVRGLHYLLVMDPHGLSQPGGAPYVNDYKCWVWLQGAAKAARWLGYIPFDRIIDERNSAPEIYVLGPGGAPVASGLSSGVGCEIPTVAGALPDFYLTGFAARQPYRIVFYGEKSSLSAILRPLAEELGTELILPTGETSHTLVAAMAARAAADGRPTIVIYFSDFDPAGWQMPVSVARQLQALKDLYCPNLDISLYPAALTLEQVRELNLPSKPLKQTERRADRWRTAMGHEQTEIDALVEVYPEVLRQIARDAVRPFYDFTLSGRVAAAELEWNRTNRAALEAHPGYAAAEKRIRAALKRLQAGADKLHAEQAAAWDALKEVVAPPPDLSTANIKTAAPEPLFDSKNDFVAATRRLIAHKNYQAPGS